MEKECIGNKWVKFNTRLFVININLLNFLFSFMPEMNMVKIESMNNWVAFLPIYCVSYFAFFHLLFRIRKHLTDLASNYSIYITGPDKSRMCVRYVLEIINFTSCLFYKYVHEYRFSGSRVREAT